MQLKINGKEVSNSVAKYLMIFAALFGITILTIFILFLLLPIIGIAATLSIGFIISLFFALIISIPALIVFALIFGRLFGGAEVRMGKRLEYHGDKKDTDNY